MSTTKSEYTQLCTEILDAVGGSKNVKNVFHCITRLRIVPVNRDAVDMDKLSKVSGILKVVESSGQIQCVIGTTVPEVYEEFLAMSGVATGGAVEAEPATDDVPEKKPNIITRGLNTLASCVTPGLYAIVAGGMIKGIPCSLRSVWYRPSRISSPCSMLWAMHPSTLCRSSSATQQQSGSRSRRSSAS